VDSYLDSNPTTQKRKRRQPGPAVARGAWCIERRKELKIRIDRDLCQGLGNCVAVAPKTFRLDAENKVFVADPVGADEKKLMQAAESCPYDAIIIEDDTGKQLYP